MTRDDCKKIIKENNETYNDSYLKIDTAIKPLVDYLNAKGFYTCGSCSSHIFDFNKKPIYSTHAYVAFLYADEDKEKVFQFLTHKFPKSKHYILKINQNWHMKYTNMISFDIHFNTRYNRVYHLKRIFKSLGINTSEKLTLDFQRPDYLTSVDWNHTVFKDGRMTKRDYFDLNKLRTGGRYNV